MNKNGGVNRVILAGRIISEPNILTGSQDAQIHFIVQTEEDISSQKGKIAHCEHHHILVADGSKSIDKNMLKLGRNVFIQGRIQTNAFTDGDNIRRYKTEVIATQVELMGS